MLPMFAIPTTAGTGSECQSYALIAEEKSHAKMACGDPKAAPKLAILDPELTLSQPRTVTACTGIDTITHAVESAVATKRNALSLMYAHEAFMLAVASFPQVLETPRDIQARGRMQLAAAFAGIAIENSMLGAAHSAANPLTAHYNVIHGKAVGIMLPHVIRFNAEDPIARRAYAELASAPELACVSEGEDYAVEMLVSRIEAFLNLAHPIERATRSVARALRIAGELIDVVIIFDRLAVDADHDALRAEARVQPADQPRIRECRRVDRHLLGTLTQDFFRIGDAANAAGDTERDVENRGHAPHPAAIDRAAVRARGDVIEHQLIGALCAIALRQLEDVAHDDVVAEAHALDDLTVPYIEARDDAFGKNGRNSSGAILFSSNARPLIAAATPHSDNERKSRAAAIPPEACQCNSG